MKKVIIILSVMLLGGVQNHRATDTISEPLGHNDTLVWGQYALVIDTTGLKELKSAERHEEAGYTKYYAYHRKYDDYEQKQSGGFGASVTIFCVKGCRVMDKIQGQTCKFDKYYTGEGRNGFMVTKSVSGNLYFRQDDYKSMFFVEYAYVREEDLSRFEAMMNNLKVIHIDD